MAKEFKFRIGQVVHLKKPSKDESFNCSFRIKSRCKYTEDMNFYIAVKTVNPGHFSCLLLEEQITLDIPNNFPNLF